MQDLESNRPEPGSEAYFKHYSKYAAQLRAWIMAIAAGGLYVLLNNTISGRFPQEVTCGRLFLAAAGIQLVLLLINKSTAYATYAEIEDDKPGSWTRFWCWVSERYWIDVLLDVVSVSALAWAILNMLNDFEVSVLPLDSGDAECAHTGRSG